LGLFSCIFNDLRVSHLHGLLLECRPLRRLLLFFMAVSSNSIIMDLKKLYLPDKKWYNYQEATAYRESILSHVSHISSALTAPRRTEEFHEKDNRVYPDFCFDDVSLLCGLGCSAQSFRKGRRCADRCAFPKLQRLPAARKRRELVLCGYKSGS
jgi:hypothetical protein